MASILPVARLRVAKRSCQLIAGAHQGRKRAVIRRLGFVDVGPLCRCACCYKHKAETERAKPGLTVRMRIAQIAPLYESVPPRLYGGTERVVAHLTDALVRRGHDVVLFASGDSKTLAELIPCRNEGLRLDRGLSWDLPAHLSMLAEVKRRAEEFDILHFHIDACISLRSEIWRSEL